DFEEEVQVHRHDTLKTLDPGLRRDDV
ncbi:MAG: hypothetical protein RL001_558, partial [Pseudomonadota bacterium]